jgi:RNA 3'-terminal phosphate cyclase (ATP)
MIEIDGAQGEGGGQVLRSALTLALVTGQPFHIYHIRARRPKPGLRPQHLMAVKAAAQVSGAQVKGLSPGSQELHFTPAAVRPGQYRFDIGTAGSTSLVLQTLFQPLSRAGGSSTLTLIGGTHVPWSPTYHYLAWHWLPILERMGFRAQLSLERAGFYPRGGGVVRATVHPAEDIHPLQLTERGALTAIRGLSLVARLDMNIARRQRRQALERLRGLGVPVEIEARSFAAPSPGTALILLALFEGSQACFSSLGKRGKPAEKVADEAVDALLEVLDAGSAVDPHLADQLLLPLALAPGPSAFTTARITQHLLTNAQVIRAFLPVQIEIGGQLGEPGAVRLAPQA